jgi:hypothetical protein
MQPFLFRFYLLPALTICILVLPPPSAWRRSDATLPPACTRNPPQRQPLASSRPTLLLLPLPFFKASRAPLPPRPPSRMHPTLLLQHTMSSLLAIQSMRSFTTETGAHGFSPLAFHDSRALTARLREALYGESLGNYSGKCGEEGLDCSIWNDESCTLHCKTRLLLQTQLLLMIVTITRTITHHVLQKLPLHHRLVRQRLQRCRRNSFFTPPVHV